MDFFQAVVDFGRFRPMFLHPQRMAAGVPGDALKRVK
jgi:hypothetical protein